MVTSLKERLKKILINSKLITSGQLNEALEFQRKKGGRLGDVLVNLGHINRKDLMVALSQELNIPPVDLSRL